MQAGSARPVLLLVDGHYLAFRSYFGFSKGGKGLRTTTGIPTSVTHGFLKFLLKQIDLVEPAGVVVAFDSYARTFRHAIDPGYKATRTRAPPDFLSDLSNLQVFLGEGLGLPVCSLEGYEADDVLGTLANSSTQRGWGVRILTGDQDLFQLVDDARDIACLYIESGRVAPGHRVVLINTAAVVARLQVAPSLIVDFKALVGDRCDNFLGVRGIGPKTAVALLKDHKTLDGIYAALEGLRPAVQRKLVAGREAAYCAQRLARIEVNAPVTMPAHLGWGPTNKASLTHYLEMLELRYVRGQLGDFIGTFHRGSRA